MARFHWLFVWPWFSSITVIHTWKNKMKTSADYGFSWTSFTRHPGERQQGTMDRFTLIHLDNKVFWYQYRFILLAPLLIRLEAYSQFVQICNLVRFFLGVDFVKCNWLFPVSMKVFIWTHAHAFGLLSFMTVDDCYKGISTMAGWYHCHGGGIHGNKKSSLHFDSMRIFGEVQR